jgi:hypothetical protein
VEKAHDGCFIANSITAAVTIEPRIDVAPLNNQALPQTA